MVTLWIRFKESLDLLTKDPLFISSVNPLEVSTHKFHSLSFPKSFHLHLHTLNTHLFFPSGCSSVLLLLEKTFALISCSSHQNQKERKEKWRERERKMEGKRKKMKEKNSFLPCITYCHHFISYSHHDSLGNNWPFFLSPSLSRSHSWFLFSERFFHPFTLASIFFYLIFLPYSFLLIHLSLTVTPLTHPFQI